MEGFSKKKNILFLLVLIGIFSMGFKVFALELNWPSSPGGITLDDNSILTELIAYIYEWAMAIGGIATFIALVSAGFQYLTSAGNATKMSDATKQITSAITGLVLLLSTFLILSTINPELTVLDIPDIELSTSIFEPIVSEDVSFGQPCNSVVAYSDSSFSGSNTEIEKGEEEEVNIDAEEGSIKFLYEGEGYDIEDTCTVKLYNSYNEDEKGCENYITTIYGDQEDLGLVGITETIKCVFVE